MASKNAYVAAEKARADRGRANVEAGSRGRARRSDRGTVDARYAERDRVVRDARARLAEREARGAAEEGQ